MSKSVDKNIKALPTRHEGHYSGQDQNFARHHGGGQRPEPRRGHEDRQDQQSVQVVSNDEEDTLLTKKLDDFGELLSKAIAIISPCMSYGTATAVKVWYSSRIIDEGIMKQDLCFDITRSFSLSICAIKDLHDGIKPIIVLCYVELALTSAM